MKKVKLYLLSIVAMLGLLTPVLMPVAVNAQATDIKGGLCAGASLDASKTTCETTDVGKSSETITKILAQLINLFSLLVGAVSVIMIIVGGLKYITSGGDSGNVTGAKNTILYAVIGLVVVALAQIIVKFVIARVNTATS